MDGYDSATYGDRIADIYDSSVELPADTGEAAAFLAELAGSGPVLELTRSNVAWPIWTLTAATSVRHSAGKLSPAGFWRQSNSPYRAAEISPAVVG